MERVTVRHIIILKVYNSQISNKLDAKRKNTEKEHDVGRERVRKTDGRKGGREVERGRGKLLF